MNAVVDRVVQFPNRYKLTDVNTGVVLGVFDFEEETGTVQAVGTILNKALFDSIATDLATRVLANGGDIKDTIATFTEASARTNLVSGDSTKTLFGKIKKFFADLKGLAFKDKTQAGDYTAGSIVNADISATANIEQSKIKDLQTQYGATLSVSGTTVTLKNKNGSVISTITTQDTTYQPATQTANGLLSSADKAKLDGVQSGAQVNNVNDVKVDGRSVVTDKVAQIIMPTQLPASDVYPWAKASSKPAYNFDEIADSTTRKWSNIGTREEIAAKYTKPSGGIPASDLASGVQTSLAKANTALQQEDLSNYVPTSRTVNGKALVSSISLGIADMTDKNSYFLGTSARKALSCSLDGGWTTGVSSITIPKSERKTYEISFYHLGRFHIGFVELTGNETFVQNQYYILSERSDGLSTYTHMAQISKKGVLSIITWKKTLKFRSDLGSLDFDSSEESISQFSYRELQ